MQNDDFIQILTGDFLKNAGIVGFVTLLKDDENAIEGEHYFIDANKLSIKREYLKKVDLTQLYFNSMINRFYNDTVLFTINKKISYLIEKYDVLVESNAIDEWQNNLKFVSEKLGSASFETGIDIIKEKIDDVEIYYEAVSKMFKNQDIDTGAYNNLMRLQKFLAQPIVHETLCFKNIIYKFINKFWERSFLLRNNAKKDMKKCFNDDFVLPLLNYLDQDISKMKDQCIECGEPIKKGVPISFMKDFADDLARKKSALYNFNVDMNLCLICTFLYALTPLGFIKYNQDFLFFNENDSIDNLCSENSIYGLNNINEIRENEKLEGKYYKIYQMIQYNRLCKERTAQYKNIQVITRRIQNDEVKYEFDIMDDFLIEILSNSKVTKELNYFKSINVIKINEEFINLFEEILKRLMNKLNLYDVIILLIKQSLINSKNNYYIAYARKILNIQYIVNRGENMNYLYRVTKDGASLRRKLPQYDKIDVDENYRGMFYQLTNALRVDNRDKFVDIILRMYITLNLKMPSSIASIKNDKEKGKDIAYAFLLGLKGSYYDPKESEGEINE